MARLNQSISAKKCDEEIATSLLEETFGYLKVLSDLDQSALAPIQIDRLFSRAKHSEKAMKIALELIDERKDTILFFKGKQNCFSELTQTFKSSKSNDIRSKICDIFSGIFNCPMWPVLEISGHDEILTKTCRAVMHDVSNANWLVNLKNLIQPESNEVENLIAEGKSLSQKVDAVPDLFVKLFLESDKLRTENFANMIGWLADDSPDGGIDRILKNMAEKFTIHEKFLKQLREKWSIGGSFAAGAKNFDIYSQFIWWTRPGSKIQD